ncbi:hypothetical protein MSPP1_001839 [Malassezia sp. CBS 17886]|nr:hypothetical protein MSPP1_001839 [Malassezia sp. CBS 17886]
MRSDASINTAACHPPTSIPNQYASTPHATSTPAKAPASPGTAPVSTPRRTARGRRATAKGAAAEAPAEAAAEAPVPAPTKAAPAPPSPLERVHVLPARTNPRLSDVKSRQVKLQVIRREDKEIIIGRIKLPTVNGAEHGFLLKRFDTNAIAGSSLFRLAFPYADAEQESAEMTYLESRFDTDLANGGVLPAPSRARGRRAEASPSKKGGQLPPGSTGVRLQGVWIPCAEAGAIAGDYGMLELAQPLLEATAALLPSTDAPVLNPDAETLAASAAQGAADAASAPLTPSRQTKRQRTVRAVEESAAAPSAQPASPTADTLSPSRARRATPRRRTAAGEDPQAMLSPAQVDAQIRAAQSLAAEITTDGPATPARASKRRAEDDAEVAVAPQTASSGVRTLRARHVPRPVARTAGVLTAASAVGIGAAAWYAGALDLSGVTSAVPSTLHQLQHIDYASALHTIQQNIQSWGSAASWFA